MRLAALLLVLASNALPACSGGEGAPAEPSLRIRGQRVWLEIVRTRAEQSRGLGYRDSLAWDRGMLFPYDDRPDFHAFWMKGMRFDIDIVWIRDGRVIDIAHRVPHPAPDDPTGTGSTVRPRELSDRVLEVPAGYAGAHGWQVGDPVAFDLEAGG
ncbi:MAG: DUF192 domain-containing protein [Deltaproteobacteria bacterium]|nr:DUF192 domain-containing protein [Deltaproteobacteria bacterium]MBW2419203.1 DUF192 domain-containing protein [Deltaproteobacteria bacterium]